MGHLKLFNGLKNATAYSLIGKYLISFNLKDITNEKFTIPPTEIGIEPLTGRF